MIRNLRLSGSARKTKEARFLNRLCYELDSGTSIRTYTTGTSTQLVSPEMTRVGGSYQLGELAAKGIRGFVSGLAQCNPLAELQSESMDRAQMPAFSRTVYSPPDHQWGFSS